MGDLRRTIDVSGPFSLVEFMSIQITDHEGHHTVENVVLGPMQACSIASINVPSEWKVDIMHDGKSEVYCG